MFTEPTMHAQIEQANRTVQLRAMQLTMAAMYRDAGDIDSEEWDGYAARYAASVRELQALQYAVMNNNTALAETQRGGTWVQLR